MKDVFRIYKYGIRYVSYFYQYTMRYTSFYIIFSIMESESQPILLRRKVIPITIFFQNPNQCIFRVPSHYRAHPAHITCSLLVDKTNPTPKPKIPQPEGYFQATLDCKHIQPHYITATMPCSVPGIAPIEYHFLLSPTEEQAQLHIYNNYVNAVMKAKRNIYKDLSLEDITLLIDKIRRAPRSSEEVVWEYMENRRKGEEKQKKRGGRRVKGPGVRSEQSGSSQQESATSFEREQYSQRLQEEELFEQRELNRP